MSKRRVSRAVSHTVTVECLDVQGRTGQLEADLLYSPLDAFAVTVVFRTAGETVPWTFARDLLVQGTTEPTGDGDVRVRPDLDGAGAAVTVLELRSLDGDFVSRARTSEVQTFLDRTYDQVPLGAEAERLDVDLAIESLLAG